MPDPNILCVNCRFFDGERRPQGSGRCRVEAPVFRPELSDAKGQWPLVLGSDWCGQFQPVEAVAGTPMSEQAAEPPPDSGRRGPDEPPAKPPGKQGGGRSR